MPTPVHIPEIAAARHVDAAAGIVVLDQLTRLVEVIDRSLYELHEFRARERMRSRDIADWPIAASSLLLNCGIWTEDQDFFGSGIATWTTSNVELYLRDT